MDTTRHNLASLFDQLGLDSSESAIENFIAQNRPLSGDIELHKAEFWTRSQASFLQENKEDDADWVQVIDELDLSLRDNRN